MKNIFFKKISICIFSTFILLLNGCGTNKEINNQYKSSQVEVTTKNENSNTNATTNNITESNINIEKSDNDLSGEQFYNFKNISFTYNADTTKVLTQNDDSGFMISVMSKTDNFLIPRVDFLGIDTTDIGGDITSNQFENLAKEIVKNYLDETIDNTSITTSKTSIELNNPENRYAKTDIKIEKVNSDISILGKVEIKYNSTQGVVSILLYEENNTSNKEDFLNTFNSIQLTKKENVSNE